MVAAGQGAFDRVVRGSGATAKTGGNGLLVLR
jgi:hypothetical protein